MTATAAPRAPLGFITCIMLAVAVLTTAPRLADYPVAGWFPHGAATVTQSSCASDGSDAAPAGSPLFPTMTAAYTHVPGCSWVDRDTANGATGLGAPAALSADSAAGTNVLHFGAGQVPGYVATGQSIHDLDDAVGDVVVPGTTITAINSGTGNVTLSANLGGAGAKAGQHAGTFTLVENWSAPACVGIRSDIHVVFIDACGPTDIPAGLDFEGGGGWEIQDSSSCVGTINITQAIFRVGTNGQSAIRMANCPVINISYVTADGASTEDVNDALISFNSKGLAVTIDHSRCLWAFSDCFDTSYNSSPGSLAMTFDTFYNVGTGGPLGAHGDNSQNFGNAFTTISGYGLVSYTTSGARSQGFGCDNGAPNTPCSIDIRNSMGVYPVSGGASQSKFCNGNLGDGATLVRCAGNWFVTPGSTFGLAAVHSFGGSGVTPDFSGNIDMVTGLTLP